MYKHFLFFVLFTAFHSYASPIQGLVKYGEGEMRVLFWDLYKAELYGSRNTYSFDDEKLLLKLTYHRNIDKYDLIDATEEQWKHVGIKHQNMSVWLSELAQIWPNIKENDVLIVTRNNDKSASFYDNSKLLGTVKDPAFSDAFFNIWLSNKTSRPKLRSKLIGDVQ